MRKKLFKSSTLASPHLRKRKRRLLIIKIVSALCLLILIVAGLSFLSKLASLTISSVQAEGTSLVDPQQVQSVAETALEGNYLWIFPKRNFLLYPKKTIKREIEKEFPAFESVNVFLKDFHTLDIQVVERKASALWCEYDGTLPDPFTDTCDLMDSRGYVYLSAPEFKGNAYLKYYGGIDGDPIGQTLLPGKLKMLGDFATGASELGLVPASFYIHGDNYDLILATGGKILLNSDNIVDDTLADLETILQNNKKNQSGGANAIDYIDLRFGNKVYFKMKPEDQ